MANRTTSNNVVHLNRNRGLARKVEDSTLQQAREVFLKQSDAIANLAGRLSTDYNKALEILAATTGHTVVSGMGKSGLIGRKISSTFSSTGTPSFFLHPGEAYHGDLGMITPSDTMIILSYSGETEEVVRLIPYLKQKQVPIISIVGDLNSTLAAHSDAVIDASVDSEVCPNNLAPTSSTLAAMAVGDALAVSLIKERDFSARDFAMFHPGGRLGRRLLTHVRDAMHTENLPLAPPFQSIRESLVTMTAGRLGLVLVVQGGKLLGIVTDGDLRRALQSHDQILDFPISRIMTRAPVVIEENAKLEDAEKRMKKEKIKALVVQDKKGKISGILEIFDK